MKSKLLSLFLIVGLGLICLMLNTRAEQSQQDDATRIDLGVMTERQREHGKLYKKYDSSRKIPELIQSQTGEVQVYRLTPLIAELEGSQPSSQERLSQIICTADTVVIGVVKSKASQLTEDQNFVFTDYEFAIEEVLKNASPTSLASNDEITVTRPGGNILLSGRKVKALDELFPLLSLGKRYLLFLRSIPTVNTYRSIESGETFLLQRSRARTLKEDALGRLPKEQDTVSLINEIRILASQPCD